MNVLVACECSQRVCKAFRDKGHNAFSCDIQKSRGGFPEWHIVSDVIPLLNPFEFIPPDEFYFTFGIPFVTEDNKYHEIRGNWDLIIAHPPCTYLTITGNRWFNVERYGEKAIQRLKNREKAVEFFMEFVNADCEKIAIENPIGFISRIYKKPDQIIHPYMFGDAERKATCLWLKGLPKLKPTEIVQPQIIKYKNSKGTDSPWHINTMKLPSNERSYERSKTFPGIARAMADQWG